MELKFLLPENGNKIFTEILSGSSTLTDDFKRFLLSMGVDPENEGTPSRKMGLSQLVQFIDAFLKLRDQRKWAGLGRFNLKTIDYAIFDNLLLGKSNKEIAMTVQLSEPAIKYHLGKNFKKFKVKNREELRTKLEELLLGAL